MRYPTWTSAAIQQEPACKVLGYISDMYTLWLVEKNLKCYETTGVTQKAKDQGSAYTGAECSKLRDMLFARTKE